jgi:EAL domain-containing protein (putative c-di-GMP-specific phosphodiesterase class I)/AmiR/NasT family two-component response regulator
MAMDISDLRFLVAEDNEFQRRWLVVMLTNLGANHIVEAADGHSALNILHDSSPPINICFIDLNMPGMDGLELIRHMAKEDNPASIILASALDPSLVFSVETMSKAYGVNLLGTIAKPATPENLLELIALYQPRQVKDTQPQSASPEFTIAQIAAGLRNNEFLPYFQPKVELETGHIKGAEAFARWHHPAHGLIPPSAFLSKLEGTEHLNTLSWAMIEKSAAACKAWHDLGSPISVSINLAADSLAGAGAAEHIAALVARHGIDPSCIILEVTESAAKIDNPQFLENLARLRMNGFVLAIDDFGTGHASNQELLRIPFSEVKIDRSFVAGASKNEAIKVVLSSSLDLARKLNRQSTAVGVETRHDWDILLQLGCTHAQGYYIAKPMESSALPAWMEEWAEFF